MARSYDLVVFDWDGTLMDSADKIVRCFQNALRDAALPDPGVEAIRQIIGLGLNEAMAALLPAHSRHDHARVADRYRDHFLHLDTTDSVLFPGVREGLDEISRGGYLLAVATGKSRRGLQRVLTETGLTTLFVATRCADEARSKPHPQMLLDILDATGMEADRALMVGDTVYDLDMARHAEVDALAVSYGVHHRAQLKVCDPLACLDSFDEVRRWLA
ncbi:MAG: HAD-IA family hydrolase [Pseudomonadota bacterium]